MGGAGTGGIRPVEAADRLTGVYIGSIGSDYGADARTLENMSSFILPVVWGSILSGRLAYVLGLQGPAMTIDTACSSSLVALHLACAALRQGECDLALAGGVQVISTAAGFVGRAASAFWHRMDAANRSRPLQTAPVGPRAAGSSF